MTAPILIACVGNAEVPGDDLGPRVARRLRAVARPELHIVDLADAPMRLLDELGDRRALLIVDAVLGPLWFDDPLVDLAWPTDVPLATAGARHSTHGLDVGAQLHLAVSLGLLPPIVRLIGWQIDPSGPFARADEAAVERVARRVLDHACQSLRRGAMPRPSTAIGG